MPNGAGRRAARSTGSSAPSRRPPNRRYTARTCAGNERGSSLLKITFSALRNVSLCPWKVGDIVAAILVILRIEH